MPAWQVDVHVYVYVYVDTWMVYTFRPVSLCLCVG
jgi:hypothetical protein